MPAEELVPLANTAQGDRLKQAEGTDVLGECLDFRETSPWVVRVRVDQVEGYREFMRAKFCQVGRVE
jgi:hypothetical protein